MSNDDEICPSCGNDPKDASLHRPGCERLDTCGQYGPPWIAPPWHADDAGVLLGEEWMDDLAKHRRTAHGSTIPL